MAKEHKKDCVLTPYILVTIEDGNGSSKSFIFTPECGCDGCESGIDDFIEMAESMKKGNRNTTEIADLGWGTIDLDEEDDK